MGQSFSFRARLLYSFWAILILALLLPSWYYYRLLTAEVIVAARNNAILQLNHFHWILSQEKDFTSPDEFQKWLSQSAAQLNVRLTYVAEGGRVIADSAVSDLSTLDNHATRPEIVQAQTEDIGSSIRFSRVTGRQEIYAARKVLSKVVVPPGTLRLAVPYDPVTGFVDRLWNNFLIVAGLMLLAMIALGYALTRHLRDPINTLVQVVQAIGGGDYNRRTHFDPGQEFYPLAEALNDLAENTNDHIQFITEQKQQLEAVFDGMQEAVMVLDSKGKIRSFNRAFSTLIARAPQSLGRRPLEAIMSLELQEACDRVISTSPAMGSNPYSLQIILGGVRTYTVNIVNLQDRRRGMGAVVVFHDITELKRLETIRQDFVANVSHELRTPLTSIRGYAETLLSEIKPDPETFSSFLQIILRNTNHMVRIVDDLLQLARLEARHQRFKPAPVNAAEALTAAWKACAPLAEIKQISLDSSLPVEGLVVSADSEQLTQVFRNLLENAIRYGPAGKPIKVFHHIREDGVVFGVSDEGPGIPKQHQQRIFERFYRIDKHRSTHPGSTGLGLAICRHIVKNHGGTIWVQSPNPDGTAGATFFFGLPAESPPGDNGLGVEESGEDNKN